MLLRTASAAVVYDGNSVVTGLHAASSVRIERKHADATTLAWILGVLSAANGLFMLLAPAAWYATLTEVQGTGPLNQHFVRDIGAAYLVAGGALIWFAIDPRARAAALAGAAFFALHALVHWLTRSLGANR
jgi:uncharacterized protein YjeT (DUF2065 family)